jgi:hypothetical protein
LEGEKEEPFLYLYWHDPSAVSGRLFIVLKIRHNFRDAPPMIDHVSWTGKLRTLMPQMSFAYDLITNSVVQMIEPAKISLICLSPSEPDFYGSDH